MATPIINYEGLSKNVPDYSIERYLGMGGVSINTELRQLIDECRPLLLNQISAKACSLEVPVTIENDYTVNFDCFSVRSVNLSKLLKGCKKAVFVVATLGPMVDVTIKREGIRSKARAFVLNSIGSAAIETYMTELNEIIAETYSDNVLRPRYSPGYGDLPLETQVDLLRVLDSNRKVGVALSNSLLMTPEKSVSAIIGIADKEDGGCIHLEKDCDICNKFDCEYRLS